MKSQIILLDCDCILSDFIESALKLIKEKTGKVFKSEDIQSSSDVFKALNIIEVSHILDDAVNSDNFCYNMLPKPGAIKAVKKLKQMGDIYVVTSPFDARNWVYERTHWLENVFDISKERIIFTKAKHMIRGDIMIDDMENNLISWKAVHPSGKAILWTMPYNKTIDCQSLSLCRVDCWNDVFALIK